jgi:uncharacterized protein
MKRVTFYIALFGLILPIHFLDSNPAHKSIRHIPEIKWEHMDKMKKSNAPTKYLKNLDGKQVRIAGFIVPLDEPDDFESFIDAQEFAIGELLLVPGMGMCMHVPPPPGNQMVLVKMKAGKKVKMGWDPIWIIGTFRLKKAKTQFGNPFFNLEGERVAKYD